MGPRGRRCAQQLFRLHHPQPAGQADQLGVHRDDLRPDAAGEEPEDGAIRELEEETGYRAGKLKKLREVYPAIGYSNEQTIIFLATDLVKTQRHLDETEDIEVLKLPIEEVKEMLDKGEIKTSSEAIGLLNYFMYEYKR